MFEFLKKRRELKKYMVLGVLSLKKLRNADINDIWEINDKKAFLIAMKGWVDRKCDYGKHMEFLSTQERVFYLTRELTHGIYLVWFIFISSWICDTCAYLSGMALGRHKLAPVLSPKKSVEGAVGGTVGSALVGALFAWIFLLPVRKDVSVVWVAAVICAAGAVISQVGDLAASAIKRNHDIKDYGKLIPGHGGILDRFDSVIFTAPVIYYLAAALGGAL